MSHEVTASTLPEKLWGGGRSPFNVEYGKLMMWIFLLSDAFTFSALLISYGTIRYSFPPSPPRDEVFSFGSHVHEGEFTKYFTPSTPGATLEAGVNPHWPSPDLVFNHFPFLHGHHLPLLFVSLMTFILIFSSVTMVLAVEAGHRNEKKEFSTKKGYKQAQKSITESRKSNTIRNENKFFFIFSFLTSLLCSILKIV